MTLALYGKSRRRQAALVVAALASIAAAVAFAARGPQHAGATTTIGPNPATAPAGVTTQDDDGPVVSLAANSLDVTFSNPLPAGQTITGATVTVRGAQTENGTIGVRIKAVSGTDLTNDHTNWAYNGGLRWVDRLYNDVRLTAHLGGVSSGTDFVLRLFFDCAGCGIAGVKIDTVKLQLTVEPPPTRTLAIEKSSANGADPTAWTLTIEAETALADTSDDLASGLGSAQATLNVGQTYHIKEAGPANWMLVDVSCTGGVDPAPGSSPFARYIQLSADDPETVTCTFVNQPSPRLLTVSKDVTDDDEVAAQNWTLIIKDAADATVGTGAGTANAAITVGESYTISESDGILGYRLKDIACTGTGFTLVKDLDAGTAAITANFAGGDIDCTVVNEPRTITARKSEANGITPTDWSITLDLDSPVTGAATVSMPAISRETYALHETYIGAGNAADYSLASLMCELEDGTDVLVTPHAEQGLTDLGWYQVTVPDSRQHVICTFTNERATGSLSGWKFNDRNGNGAGPDAGEEGLPGWTIELRDGTGATLLDTRVTAAGGDYDFGQVPTGTYRVCEVEQAAWVRTSPAGSNCFSGVAVTDGGNTARDFFNWQPGKITIKKLAPEDPAQEFPFSVSPTNGTPGPFSLLHGEEETWSSLAGSYTITETPPPGWNLSGIVCTNKGESQPVDGVPGGLTIALAAGDDWLCTITNVRETGTIWNVKVVVNDSDDVQTFLADITGPSPRPDVTFAQGAPHSFEALAGDGYLSVEDPPGTDYGHVATVAYDGATLDWDDADEPICPDFSQETLRIDGFAVLDQVAGSTLADGAILVFCHYNYALGHVTVEKVDLSERLVGPFDILVHNDAGKAVGAAPFTLPEGGGASSVEVDVGEDVFTLVSETLGGTPVPFGPETCESDRDGSYFTYQLASNDAMVEFAGDEVKFIVTNHDCPEVAAKGNLRVFKWNDQNGNGAWDDDEDPVEGWKVTVSGPEYPGGADFFTDAAGRIDFDDILAGAYTVTEAQQGGWYQTGLQLTVAGQDILAIVKASATAEVKDALEEDDPDTIVRFGNRQLATVIVLKEVDDQAGDRGVSGWHINLAGCGTSINRVTDASGTAVFSNLLPADSCAYTATETDPEGFTVAYPTGQVVAPGPGEISTVNVHNARVPAPTFDAPAQANTPAATPTVTATPEPPAATPETPTEEPSPTEAVAGERTPGPVSTPPAGSLATPIAPEAGSGTHAGGTAASVTLAAFALLIVTAGTLFVALGRERG